MKTVKYTKPTSFTPPTTTKNPAFILPCPHCSAKRTLYRGYVRISGRTLPQVLAEQVEYLEILLAAAALLTQDRWRHMRRLALVVLLTWGLAAFWLAPLLAHPGYTTPIVRANLQQTVSFLRAQWMDLFIVPVIAAGVGFVFHSRARRAATFGVLSGGLAVTGFIFLDHRLLMDRLDFYLLDPVRFAAGAHMALIAAIALGVAELAWLMPRLLRRWRLAPFALILLVAVPYFFYSRINQVFPFDQKNEMTKRWLAYLGMR
jgi:hypothetical protein